MDTPEIRTAGQSDAAGRAALARKVLEVDRHGRVRLSMRDVPASN